MAEYKALMQFLQDNIFSYKEEYNLLIEKNQPPFVKNSFEVKELRKDDAYFFSYDWLAKENLKRCHYLSISGEKIQLEELENIICGHDYQIMSNVYLGNRNFSDGRNYYGTIVKNIKSGGNLPDRFEFIEITRNNIGLLKKIEKDDEDFYLNIKAAVYDSHDDFSMLAVICGDDMAAYVLFDPDFFNPTVYTKKEYRGKDLAFILLSHCSKKYFPDDGYLTYHADSGNDASNALAKKLGFGLLNTQYFYYNYLQETRK